MGCPWMMGSGMAMRFEWKSGQMAAAFCKQKQGQMFPTTAPPFSLLSSYIYINNNNNSLF